MSVVMNNLNGDNAQNLYYVSMQLSPSQIQGMFATPVQILPSPGANKAFVVKNWGYDLSFGGTAYTLGGVTGLYYDTVRAQIATSTITAASMNAGASLTNNITGSTGIINATNTINKPLYISNSTQAFSTGNSNVTVYLFYSIIAFDTTSIQNSVNTQVNAAGFNFTQKIISSSQIQNLSTTPVSLVSALGSGIAIIPTRCILALIYNSIAYTSSVLSIVPSGGSAMINSTNTFLSQTNNEQQQLNLGVSNYSPSSLNNVDIQIKAGASPGASGNSQVKVYLNYMVVQL